MLPQNATIFPTPPPPPPRLFSRLFVPPPRLHPNHFRPHPNRALHHRRHLLRAPEHVHNLNFFRHIFQPPITLLPQHFPLVRIHRNDPVSRLLHIFRHAKTRPHRISRQSDPPNGLTFFQEFKNPVR